MKHQTVQDAMYHIKSKINWMTARQLMQVPFLLEKLYWTDREMWRRCEHNILRLLHKYKASDLAMFIDLFDRDYLD